MGYQAGRKFLKTFLADLAANAEKGTLNNYHLI
jgi:hypothetical protein